MDACKLIAVGGSAGGITALQKIFSMLPAAPLPPIVVVLHLARESQIDPGLIFAHSTHRRVFEAEDKMPLEADCIYMAPPGYHLLVESGGTVCLTVDEPVHFSRPSIDIFFESAASAYGPTVAGVLLTGANQDGAEGLQAIQEKGGFALVQSPESADARAMPLAALKLFTPDLVCDLDRIGENLGRFTLIGVDA